MPGSRDLDPRRWSLAAQMLVLLAVALAVVVAVGVVAAYVQARSDAQESARRQALAVARTLAEDPLVRAVATSAGSDPRASSARLQPLALEVQRRSRTSFVVVMSPAGIRWTHPDPAQIGGRFVGHIATAAAGGEVTETYTGTLGPSVRAVVPVLSNSSPGEVVALVAVGITTRAVGQDVARQLPLLLGAGLVALGVAVAVAAGLARRLRRQTHGLGAADLSRMYEFHDAMLHAVREGLLILDTRGTVTLANDEARRLLGLPEASVGRYVLDAGLPPSLARALAGGHRRVDEVHLAGDRVLVVSQAPASWGGRLLGSVVTLRDHTELLALAGELDSVRTMAESLRSQAHESANRLHAVVSLIEIGESDRAVEFATAELGRAQAMTDRVVGAVGDPVVAALLLGKATQAHERGVDLRLAEDVCIPDGAVDASDLVTILGNLLDNATDAAAGAPLHGGFRWVKVESHVVDGWLQLCVSDSGPGVAEEDVDQVFTRGWSTKEAGRLGARGLGLALARAAAARHGGSVTLRRHDGGGAVFTVALPLAQARAAIAATT